MAQDRDGNGQALPRYLSKWEKSQAMIKFVKKRLKARLRSFALSTVREDLERTLRISDQISAFRASSENERQSYHDRIKDLEALKKRFREAGIVVEDAKVDVDDFERWLKEFHEVEGSYRGSPVHTEKSLEHYLAFKWHALSKEDACIDVAACCSVWSEALNNRGYHAYKHEWQAFLLHQSRGDRRQVSGPEHLLPFHVLLCPVVSVHGSAEISFIRPSKGLP